MERDKRIVRNNMDNSHINMKIIENMKTKVKFLGRDLEKIEKYLKNLRGGKTK